MALLRVYLMISKSGAELLHLLLAECMIILSTFPLEEGEKLMAHIIDVDYLRDVLDYLAS